MIEFKVDEIFLDVSTPIADIPKINNSEVDDILSQIILFKISNFAHSLCMSLHNQNYGKQHTQRFLFASMPIDMMSEKPVSQQRTLELFDLSKKLATPPNSDFKKVVTLKFFSKFGVINGEKIQILFNPYFLALGISEIYFRLCYDERVKEWCNKGKMRKESIDKIVEIINDKYSYRFVELYEIAHDFLAEIYNSENSSEKMVHYAYLTGLNGDLLHSYIEWMLKFYESDLLPTVETLLDKIKYEG